MLKKNKTLILMAGILILGGGFIIILSSCDYCNDNIRSTTETGIVTEKIYEPAHIKRGMMFIWSYKEHIPERWIIHLKTENEKVTPSLRISKSLYESIKVGQKLTVTYTIYLEGCFGEYRVVTAVHPSSNSKFNKL